MIVSYEDSQNITEYQGNFAMDNGLSKEGWSQKDIDFSEGETKHIFRFHPVYNTAMLAEDLIAYAYLSGGTQGATEMTISSANGLVREENS